MQQVMTNAALPYLLHMPVDYVPGSSAPLPLIVFLHGSGERGDDLALVKLYGLPRGLDDKPDFPFVVASPQCPFDVRWTELADEVVSVVETVAGEAHVDRSRIYLTGFSMGGQGTWKLAVDRPELFAAVAPVAARLPPAPDFLDQLCALGALPVWAAHGDADDVVPFEDSQTMVDTLRGCGGDVRFTRYPGLGHGEACDAFYAGNEGDALVSWFLQHRR